METKILILTLMLVLLLTAGGVALAQGGSVERSRWALGGGASDSAGGDVTLRATLGQPVVGVVTSGGGQQVILGQGFWHSGGLAGDGYDIYLPLVLR